MINIIPNGLFGTKAAKEVLKTEGIKQIIHSEQYGNLNEFPDARNQQKSVNDQEWKDRDFGSRLKSRLRFGL